MSRVAYSATKDVFINDVKWNRFIPKMREGARLNHIGSGYSEISSWKSNAPSVRNLLELSQIPNDVIVSFEYKVPNGGRIDCMLYGQEAGLDVHLMEIDFEDYNKPLYLADFVDSHMEKILEVDSMADYYLEKILVVDLLVDYHKENYGD